MGFFSYHQAMLTLRKQNVKCIQSRCNNVKPKAFKKIRTALFMNSLDTCGERVFVQYSIEGVSKAFEAPYLLYVERIYRPIHFRVGDKANAEVMTEEVFMRSWQALPKCQLG